MERKVVSGIMLTLLLVSMLTLAINIQPAESEPATWTVDDDGPADFRTIQEAINAASPGDTVYVYNGIYYEQVAVNKTLSLVGEDRNTTVIDGDGTGKVVDITADDVEVRGFTIRNGREYRSIVRCLSNGNEIVGNFIEDGWAGVKLYRSDRNTLDDNVIANTYYSIEIIGGSYNVIQRNLMFNTSVGIDVRSLTIANIKSDNNMIRKNSIANCSVIGVLIKDNSENNVVSLNNMGGVRDGQFQGIFVYRANGNIIYGNRMEMDVMDGIELFFSNNSVAAENYILPGRTGRGGVGFRVGRSNNNSISRNFISGGDTWRGTLYLSSSHNNTIEGNTIVDSKTGDAIHLLSSRNNKINRNYIANNSGASIAFADNSDGNTISDNILSNNTFGIKVYLYGGNGNIIFHNNFINNTEQGRTYTSTNTWDDGYPSGGNYWSDYEDRYPDAYELDDSGIWNTPYTIDENNQDNYPLIEPWSPVVSATVDIDPDTLNLRSICEWIACYLELPEGYNVSDIDISTVMLNDTVPVSLLDVPAPEPVPVEIGDYDNDGIPDLMVKFNRTMVSELILSEGITQGNVTLTITGEVDEAPFEGSGSITVVCPFGGGRGLKR